MSVSHCAICRHGLASLSYVACLVYSLSPFGKYASVDNKKTFTRKHISTHLFFLRAKLKMTLRNTEI